MSGITRHRIESGVDKSVQSSVKHTSQRAYQFDFYVPKKIWKVRVVERFFEALAALGGATVFDDEIGIWKGDSEKTQVFRLVVREGDRSISEVRRRLRREVGQLMADLSVTRHVPEAVMYTETLIRVYLANQVTRIE